LQNLFLEWLLAPLPLTKMDEGGEYGDMFSIVYFYETIRGDSLPIRKC